MTKGSIRLIALINSNNQAYIIRTRSKYPSTVIRRHIRGNCRLTRPYYGNVGTKRPKAHLLAVLDMSYYDSYKYLLAYICILRSAGYYVLNHPNTLIHAENLHPDTLEVFESLRSESVVDLLDRTMMQKYTDADALPQSNVDTTTVRKDHKITIRVTKADRDRFTSYAQGLHMTQGEALSGLLTNYQNNYDMFIDWSADRFVGQLLDDYRNRCKNMQNKIDDQQKHWANQRVYYNARINALKIRLNRIQQALRNYYSYYKSSCAIPIAIETNDYRKFTHDQYNSSHYDYPNEDGWCLLRPVAILYGKARTPVRFIVGIDTNGRNIKLRVYDKDYFAGIPVSNTTFGLRGSVWLVAWERANDGAMDLALALPMDLKPRYSVPWTQTNEFSCFLAGLDDEINDCNDLS